jgi:hypothetical protein
MAGMGRAMNTSDAVRWIGELFVLAAVITLPVVAGIVYLGERAFDEREREKREHPEIVPHRH